MNARRLASWLLRTVGIAATLGGLLLIMWSTTADHAGAVVAALALTFLVGPGLWRFGARLAVIPGEQLMAQDERPPVLYLRSFEAEERAHRFWSVLGRIGSVPMLPGFSPWAPMEQWRFAKQMRRIGPYVTVARPGQRLPELGASPIYLDADEWEGRVLALLEKSRLVVIRGGSTPGLRWEVEMVLKHVDPGRLLLIAPALRKDYRPFREWMNKRLPKPLPERLEVRLFRFAGDWQPLPMDLESMSSLATSRDRGG